MYDHIHITDINVKLTSHTSHTSHNLHDVTYVCAAVYPLILIQLTPVKTRACYSHQVRNKYSLTLIVSLKNTSDLYSCVSIAVNGVLMNCSWCECQLNFILNLCQCVLDRFMCSRSAVKLSSVWFCLLFSLLLLLLFIIIIINNNISPFSSSYYYYYCHY